MTETEMYFAVGCIVFILFFATWLPCYINEEDKKDPTEVGV